MNKKAVKKSESDLEDGEISDDDEDHEPPQPPAKAPAPPIAKVVSRLHSYLK